MSTSDGTVIGVTKIVDHGADAARWNIVILGDGYQQSELATYSTDAQSFVNYLQKTTPFDKLWPAINVHRVDVNSTDSGAADPAACGGTGATPKTYFDAKFCSDGQIRRLLQVNTATALNVSSTQVPAVEMTFVVVNSTTYGGSGGQVAVFSKDPNSMEIAVHEMGHTAFALADEYEYYAGCGSGETGHDNYAGGEPAEPNVTANKDKATIKWAALIGAATPIPTTSNSDCSKCDPQLNPVSATTVGAFEGARYFHCGLFRPQFNCRMRVLGNPFCAACNREIVRTISPYLPLPVVTGVSPNAGAAGLSVVITGTGFTGATSVGFGVTGSPSITVNSDTQITAVSPPALVGTVDITVITANGASATSAADQFTYGASPSLPVVTGINPNSGPAGTSVVISGSGFTGATTVGFGATGSPNITVNSDTQITAVTPFGSGTVDVTVVTPAGSSTPVAADQFAYGAASGLPVVTGISPKMGSAGSTVTISGSGFTGATAVSFGVTGSPKITVSSDNQIVAVSPAGGIGTVDVTVVTPAGTSAVSAADQFTYGASTAVPVIGAISPGSGSPGTIVTISGSGFTGATSVGFGAIGSPNITVNSDTQITAISPAGGSGTVDISVITAAGASAPTAADRFAYITSGVAGVPTTGTPTGTPGVQSGPVGPTAPTLPAGSVSPAGYYVDPGLTSQLVGSIVNILQSASSPDALEAQNMILRRIALQGDVIGSRIPPPRNISEIGGYMNLLGMLKQPELRSQALAGILGVAGPADPLGWISNNQPLAFVTLPNDRPPGVAQPTISLTFVVRSDFNSALQNALAVLHQQGCTLPVSGRPAITLPQATPGALPPDDALPYLGRTLDLVTGAALLNPQLDPLVLVRARGSSDPFQIASNVLTPGVPVPPGNYDALQCNVTSCAVVPINNSQCVPVGPILASAGFYAASPLPTPSSVSSSSWAHFTNLTGLVAGVTKLGDELSLLYNWSTINHSVFASALHRIWNGAKFA